MVGQKQKAPSRMTATLLLHVPRRSLAKSVNLTANTELDIKVLDEPTKVADIKQKVLSFLHMPNVPVLRNTTKIIDVERSQMERHQHHLSPNRT
jgi:hypothetical protein